LPDTSLQGKLETSEIRLEKYKLNIQEVLRKRPVKKEITPKIEEVFKQIEEIVE
jgi:hypothetical protein